MFQKMLPFLVSAGLLAWLIGRVSPQALVAAAGRLDWQPLVLLTFCLVLGLFVWDAVCLRWLFGRTHPTLGLWPVLQARGSSYLISAVNYELGQGVLAWKLARALDSSVISALGCCFLLLCHDLFVLLALGFAGSLLRADPASGTLRWVSGGGLVLLAGAGVAATFLVRGRREELGQTRWGAWLEGWSWQRSLTLGLLRGFYYLLILAYAALGLGICRIPVDGAVIFGVVPLVLLVDGLPVSVSGLGTRETALCYFLNPEQPGTLLAFSLAWSTGLVLGRLAIGLCLWWVPTPTARAVESGKEKS